MICPQCGYDIGNKNKCVRCGYEIKTLATVDETKKRDERSDTKIIDPSNVYISNGSDDFDDGFDPFDPFSMLFGNIFDPIGDLLGGLFGLDVRTSHSHSSSHTTQEREPKRKKQGKVVEVNNVEFLDENGNPVDGNSKKSKKKNDQA